MADAANCIAGGVFALDGTRNAPNTAAVVNAFTGIGPERHVHCRLLTLNDHTSIDSM
jgi:hypothetical protein